MGNNYYTKWISYPSPGYTVFDLADMDGPLSTIDRAITYLKNIVVNCDGVITYNPVTGVLTWTNTLRIFFNRIDGEAILNTVPAGSVTLANNEFAYADLSETNNAAVSVVNAAITTGAASNFLTFNRVVLGYRNSTLKGFYPVYLKNIQSAVISLTSGASLTVDWSQGKTQKVTAGHDIAFTFSGASDGDKLLLIVKQDPAVLRNPTLPATVRYGTDITTWILTQTYSKKDRIGFVYDGDDTKYDLVALVQGF